MLIELAETETILPFGGTQRTRFGGLWRPLPLLLTDTRNKMPDTEAESKGREGLVSMDKIAGDMQAYV